MDAVPNKSLGQHWLFDGVALGRMADAIGAKTGDTVVEIGPGLGTLTQVLLERGTRVIAVEFDESLAVSLENRLREQGADTSQLTVVRADIRQFRFDEVPQPYKVCANIPYYLTSNLVRMLTDTNGKPSEISLLVQKEVAERIVSINGKSSLLSCIAQLWYDCSLDIVVPASLFTPPPKVDSQILIMKKRESPSIDGQPDKLYRLFKAGFSEKRKNLRNALSGGLAISKESVVEMLVRAEIEPTRRAETLTLKEWEKLFNIWSNT